MSESFLVVCIGRAGIDGREIPVPGIYHYKSVIDTEVPGIAMFRYSGISQLARIFCIAHAPILLLARRLVDHNDARRSYELRFCDLSRGVGSVIQSAEERHEICRFHTPHVCRRCTHCMTLTNVHPNSLPKSDMEIELRHLIGRKCLSTLLSSTVSLK